LLQPRQRANGNNSNFNSDDDFDGTVMRSLRGQAIEERKESKRKRNDGKKRKKPKGQKATKKKRSAANNKKKQKTKNTKTSKTVKADTSDNDSLDSFKYWWWSSKYGNGSTEDSSDNSSHRSEATSVSLKKEARKRVFRVDMSGDLDMTDHTYTETTAHETLGSSQEWSISSPMARKIHEDNIDNTRTYTTPVKWDTEDDHRYPSMKPSLPTTEKISIFCPKLAPVFTVSDSDEHTLDVSIISDYSQSEDILDNLSCVLDCDEDEEIDCSQKIVHDEPGLTDGDGNCTQNIQATGSFVDLVDSAPKIEPDAGDCNNHERSTEAKGSSADPECDETDPYVDVYCQPMKRISDITNGTLRISMESAMCDNLSWIVETKEEEKESFRSEGNYNRRYKSNNTPAVDVKHWGNLPKRISDLTEATIYELENEDDESSTCPGDSDTHAFDPIDKPLFFYSTPERSTDQDVYNPFKDRDTEASELLLKKEKAVDKWDDRFASNDDVFSHVSFSPVEWATPTTGSTKKKKRWNTLPEPETAEISDDDTYSDSDEYSIDKIFDELKTLANGDDGDTHCSDSDESSITKIFEELFGPGRGAYILKQYRDL
jgi:hypothetical protein